MAKCVPIDTIELIGGPFCGVQLINVNEKAPKEYVFSGSVLTACLRQPVAQALQSTVCRYRYRRKKETVGFYMYVGVSLAQHQMDLIKKKEKECGRKTGKDK